MPSPIFFFAFFLDSHVFSHSAMPPSLSASDLPSPRYITYEGLDTRCSRNVQQPEQKAVEAVQIVHLAAQAATQAAMAAAEAAHASAIAQAAYFLALDHAEKILAYQIAEDVARQHLADSLPDSAAVAYLEQTGPSGAVKALAAMTTAEGVSTIPVRDVLAWRCQIQCGPSRSRDEYIAVARMAGVQGAKELSMLMHSHKKAVSPHFPTMWQSKSMEDTLRRGFRRPPRQGRKLSKGRSGRGDWKDKKVSAG